MDFFAGLEWQQVAAFLVSILAGLSSVGFFGKLKSWIGWDDLRASYLIQVTSLLLSAAGIYVAGLIGVQGLEFTLVNVLVFGGSIYKSSQLAYQSSK